MVISLVLLFLNGFSQQQLPDVTVENPGGDRYAIKEVMNDSVPVVLAFWATTCKPCIQELDALSEVLRIGEKSWILRWWRYRRTTAGQR